MISIIIPIYNRLPFLMETLESLQQQSYKGFEVILVDDYSEPGFQQAAAAVVAKSSLRIQLLLKKEESKGVSASRNKGLLQSAGDYIMFLDSDDKLHPQAVHDRALVVGQHPGKAFYVFDAVYTGSLTRQAYGRNNFGQLGGKDVNVEGHYQEDAVDIMGMGGHWNVTNGVLYNKAFLLQHQLLFDETYTHYEDQHFMLRVLEQKPAYIKYARAAYANVVIIIHEEQQASLNNAPVYNKAKANSMILFYQYIFSNPFGLASARYRAAVNQRFYDLLFLLAEQGMWQAALRILKNSRPNPLEKRFFFRAGLYSLMSLVKGHRVKGAWRLKNFVIYRS